jgi:hypothetical protein
LTNFGEVVKKRNMTKKRKNLYFLGAIIAVGIGLFFLFGLIGVARAYDLCDPFFQGFFCSSDCSHSGRTRCVDNLHREICGNYDADEYLEWSPLKSCLGDTSCGYRKCKDNERPHWYCFDGNCRYKCIYDESCALSSCECSEGVCCDGCHYRPSDWICGSDSQTQYGCPWGSACGADVGKRTRTRLKYCSGSSSECGEKLGGWLPWTSWKVADKCGMSETCNVGGSSCLYSSLCASKLKPALSRSQGIYSSDKENKKGGLAISLLGKKEGGSLGWSREIKAGSGKYIDFLLVVANKGKKELNNVVLKAEFPQGVVYKDDLKIAGSSPKGDLKSGLNLYSLSPGNIKTITFKGAVSSGIGSGEKNVVVRATGENLSASSSLKISFNGLQGQEAAIGASLRLFLGKWYNWILIILGAAVLFYFIKGFLNWFKK